VLEAHSDEVWHVQFSHAGDRLASASKDCSAAVWRLRPGAAATLVHSLRAHERPLTYLAWSPDDSRLLTCGHDNVVRRPGPWPRVLAARVPSGGTGREVRVGT
jgi:WD40 repeat protein